MTRVEDNVAFTQRLGEWLRRSGVDAAVASGLAVDIADIVAAAELVKELALSMTEANLDSAGDADAALSQAAEIEVQLFTELKSHLGTLAQTWPGLLEHLDTLSERNLDV